MKTTRRRGPSPSTGLVRRGSVGLSQSAKAAGSMTSEFSQKIDAPAGVVGHGPAQQRTDAEAQHQESGPGADRPWALRFGNGLGRRRQHAGNGEGGAQPLQRAGADEHGPSGASAMISEAKANKAIPAAEERRGPNWSAARPPRMMKTAAASR